MEAYPLTTPMEGLDQLDGETFRRVWERVMPDQSLSPVTLREEHPTPRLVPSDNHYIGGLEGVMDEVQQWQGRLEYLGQRNQGKTSAALHALAVGEGRQLRRLSTLYYLLTGHRYQPRPPRPAVGERLRDSLRQGFLEEMGWEKQYTHMVHRLEGEALIEIAQELHQGAMDQSRQIRTLLEVGMTHRGKK